MDSKNIAIRVENLSKCYRIGSKEARRDTVGGAVIDFLKSPLRKYRKYRSLYKFDDATLREGGRSGDASDVIWALEDISFDVKEGEVLGIIGRNGAGKSTLLKILSRITDPTKGQAEIRGRVSSLLEVGTGFHPELTGRENIYLNGSILGMKKREIDRQFDAIVAFSEVEKFLDTPVKRYSSGMRVRLAFSVAAHLEPEILVIDEVLAVGDASFQKKCLGKMRDVGSEGRTVLFVSHNMYIVRELCSRVLLLEHGRVLQSGDAETIVDSYLEDAFKNMVEGEVFLQNWPGKRMSPGAARIRVIRILNGHGEICPTFAINDSITFEVELENLPQNGFCISFLIRTLQGLCVYHIRSQDSDLKAQCVDNSAVVRMTIPTLKLVEGSYSVNVWLGNHLNQMEDFAENVMSFHVLNKGKSLQRLNSVIYETGQWSLS